MIRLSRRNSHPCSAGCLKSWRRFTKRQFFPYNLFAGKLQVSDRLLTGHGWEIIQADALLVTALGNGLHARHSEVAGRLGWVSFLAAFVSSGAPVSRRCPGNNETKLMTLGS